MKSLAGRARRLYISAQTVLVLAVVFVAIPFWVVRLHDRYVSRAAVECWMNSPDASVVRAFSARAAEALLPDFNEGCRGRDCAERVSLALSRQHFVTPGEEHGIACRMRTRPLFREFNSEISQNVEWCARNLVGREALSCQIGQVAGTNDVIPFDLWASDEARDRAWAFASTSGDLLIAMVYRLHPVQTILVAILTISPLLLAGFVRWLRWVHRGDEPATKN